MRARELFFPPCAPSTEFPISNLLSRHSRPFRKFAGPRFNGSLALPPHYPFCFSLISRTPNPPSPSSLYHVEFPIYSHTIPLLFSISSDTIPLLLLLFTINPLYMKYLAFSLSLCMAVPTLTSTTTKNKHSNFTFQKPTSIYSLQTQKRLAITNLKSFINDNLSHSPIFILLIKYINNQE